MGRPARSLRTVIGASFGLVGFLTAALVGLVSGEITYGQRRQQLADGLAELARDIQRQLNEDLAERLREIVTASTVLSALDPLLTPEAGRRIGRVWLERLQTALSDYAWIGIVDAEGQVLLATRGLLEGRSVSARPWFAAGLAGPFLGDVHDAKLLESLLQPQPDGEPWRFVDVAAPLRDPQGRARGVIGAHLDWGWAARVARRQVENLPGRRIDVLIRGSEGNTLARVRAGPAIFDEAAALRALAAGRIDIDGVAGQHLLGHALARRGDGATLEWDIVAIEDASGALDAARRLRWLVVGAGLAVGIAWLGFGFWLAGQLTRPLVRLAATARSIDQLDAPTAIPREGAAEIRSLATDLESLVHRLTARSAELARVNDALEQRVNERTAELHATLTRLGNREAWLTAIHDHAAEGILVVAADGEILSANACAGRQFEYAPAQLVGLRLSELLVLPGAPDGKSSARVIDAMLRQGVGATRREFEGLRAGGARFPIDLAAADMGLADQRLVVCVVHDISERKQLERLKSEFVSTVSHELRTPLTSISGALGLVLGGAAGELPARARRMIEVASKNSERLALLINDILDIEKIEAGKLEYTDERMQLRELLVDAVEANRAYAERLGVTLVLDAEIEPIEVVADRYRLMQVLANLISNAAKFSPGGSEVIVRLSNGEIGPRVAVIDHGRGIPAAFQSRIFQKFAQADASDSREKGGTGLGLNIVQKIVERHGGQIGFISAEGRGTTFWFELPPASAAASAGDPPGAG